MRLELRLPIRPEHKLIEDLRVQKVRIGLAGLCPIARVLRITWDRDLLPHLEIHLKVFGNLIELLSELVRCRRAVKRRVIADRAETGLPLVQILAILA